MTLKTDNWKEFKLEDLFEIKKGIPISSHELELGDLNYVTRTVYNNGVTSKGSYSVTPYEGNCITLGTEGLIAFYQKDPFITGTGINILTKSSLNNFISLFLCTIINFNVLNRYSYSYSLSLLRTRNLTIKLPIDSTGKPNWESMEEYIKTLLELILKKEIQKIREGYERIKS